MALHTVSLLPPSVTKVSYYFYCNWQTAEQLLLKHLYMCHCGPVLWDQANFQEVKTTGFFYFKGVNLKMNGNKLWKYIYIYIYFVHSAYRYRPGRQ